jgi:hypothetical protein
MNTELCKNCNIELIPIIYGYVGPAYLDMHKQGLIFLISINLEIPNYMDLMLDFKE